MGSDVVFQLFEMQGGSITVESLQALYRKRTEDVFWQHLFVRVAYLQDERQLVRGIPEESDSVRPEQREQRLPFTL